MILPHDRRQSRRYSATLLASQRLTPEASGEEVRRLVFKVDDVSFSNLPGENIRVAVPVANAQPHCRLYAIAEHQRSLSEFALCVRRCRFVDADTLESHSGVASGFLCDLQVGEKIDFTGPEVHPFPVPWNRKASIVMVGMGTGVAPFHAFVRNVFRTLGGWEGRVGLFHGDRTGLEMRYANDEQADLAHYFDPYTFRAFQALGPSPRIDAPADPKGLPQAHAAAVWETMCEPATHVFVAGRAAVLAALEGLLSAAAQSEADWKKRTARMQAEGRWVQIVY